MCIIQIFESFPHHVELVGSTTSQIVIPADSNQRQLSYHRFLITFAVITATSLLESGEDLILARARSKMQQTCKSSSFLILNESLLVGYLNTLLLL